MKLLLVHDRDMSLPLRMAEQREESGGGGVETYLFGLARGLLAKGFELSEVRLANGGGSAGEADAAGRYRVRASGVLPRPRPVRELEEIVRREAPDIVHVHSPHYALSAVAMRRLARSCPTVLTQHDVTPICFKHTKLRSNGQLCERAVGWRCLSDRCYVPGTAAPLSRDGLRLAMWRSKLHALRQAARIIAPSRYLAAELQRNGFAAGQIAVVPNFSAFAVDPAPPPDGRRMLFVGRLVPEKGIKELLAALPLLRTPGWELSVVGDGPLADAVRACRDGGAPNRRVRLLGNLPRSELAAHYRAANVVVLPSLIPESFGLVGVEAMAFGRPVVAFKAGGILEWLEDGRTGLLADRGEVRQLAAHLDRLLGSPETQRRFGTAGARRVAEHFTLDAHMSRLIPVYRSAIADFAAEFAPTGAASAAAGQ